MSISIAGRLARAALFTGVEFAIGGRRIATLWRLEDLLRDNTRGAAMRHLPSGHETVDRAWKWAPLP